MDTNTSSLLSLSASQLRKAADLKERIDTLSSELSGILSGVTGSTRAAQPAVAGRGGARRMSAAGRARIAAAARERWAKIRAAKGDQNGTAAKAKTGRRRTMSPAAREKIAAAARARWARVRAGKA